MKNKLLGVCFGLFPLIIYANDSTGYVSTGGIQYIKNKNIAMESEDLYISQEKIDVTYQFKNLTNRDITETILFPLPALSSEWVDGSFANTEQLLNSFQVKVNGKVIKPKRHINILLLSHNSSDSKSVDITAALLQCGISEKLLLDFWKGKIVNLEDKLAACSHKLVQDSLKTNTDLEVQITYSWQQNFKANAVTTVQHHYQPLVGGGVRDIDWLRKNDYSNFCIDKNFLHRINILHKNSGSNPLFLTHELSYILTTGANWAKPIGKFTLTIERKSDELVSLCWDKSLRKINNTQFRAVKTNFIPKYDLNILFTK